jgi:hypothetical protein
MDKCETPSPFKGLDSSIKKELIVYTNRFEAIVFHSMGPGDIL